MLTDKEVRQQIIQITNDLFSTGHLTATGGNVSATSNGGETIWITPSGLYKGDLSEEVLVHIKPDGTVIEGEFKPSIEFKMHFNAYAARPGTSGAVHTHSPAATAFGICNRKFDPINTDAVLLADTPIVPWFMPGTQQLADAVGEALERNCVCIMQNHGVMTVGEDLRKAATRAMLIEGVAKIQLYVNQFGGDATLLPREAVEELSKLSDFI